MKGRLREGPPFFDTADFTGDLLMRDWIGIAVLPVCLTGVCLTGAGQAHAANRAFTVTSFDRIRVEGPYKVDVRTGAGPSAKGMGDVHALDRMQVEVQGTTLIVRTDRSGWTGWPGQQTGEATLAVTTPALSSAVLGGSGSVSINRMAGSRVDISVAGSGDVSIGRVEADGLRLTLAGSGKAAQARVTVQGSGDVDAAGLTVQDADVLVAGSGNVSLSATRRATVKADGVGKVTISGKPACAVTSSGSAVVRCGQ